jgi:hypothetical protein
MLLVSLPLEITLFHEYLRNTHPERVGNLFNVLQADVPFSPFNAPDICPVEFALLSEPLL